MPFPKGIHNIQIYAETRDGQVALFRVKSNSVSIYEIYDDV